jgi:anti-sigma B factor antagonist
MEQVTHNLRVSGSVEGEIARLRVTGDVDLATAQVVREAVCEALDAGAHEIELDLGGVTFLDSTGLSVLLHAARDVDRRRAELRTLAPSGSEARVVIDLARVTNVLRLQEAATDAQPGASTSSSP